MSEWIFYLSTLLCVGCVWQPLINEHDDDDDDDEIQYSKNSKEQNCVDWQEGSNFSYNYNKRQNTTDMLDYRAVYACSLQINCK